MIKHVNRCSFCQIFCQGFEKLLRKIDVGHARALGTIGFQQTSKTQRDIQLIELYITTMIVGIAENNDILRLFTL